MNEHVFTAGTLNESVSLGPVEPLNYALLLHSPSPSCCGQHVGETSRLCSRLLMRRICQRQVNPAQKRREPPARLIASAVAARFIAELGLCFPNTKHLKLWPS